MAKKKHEVSLSTNGKEISAAATEALLGEAVAKRPYEIIEAHIKDGFCNYVFRITEGVGLFEKHKVDGAGMVKNELEHAFGRLHVHLAVIDGIFQHSETEIDDVDKFHTHDLTDLYHVTGIKLYGSEDNESVVLIGSKHVSYVGGRINISTPKIPLDNLSSYTWRNELAQLVAMIKEEVSLYKEGNYVMPEQDEEEESHKKKGQKIKQLTIGDEISDREAERSESEFGETDLASASGTEDDDMDFESAKQ